MPCNAMHPIQHLFLESFSYALQFDMHFYMHTVVKSCDVTFDKTAPCPRGVFECAGDMEMEESIFVDEGLQGIDGDEYEPLLPSTSSTELVPNSTFEAEAPQATTSSTAAAEASRVEGEITSELRAPSHIQKAHPPQEIIGNLNERVTRSSRSAISLAFQIHSLLPSLSLKMLDTLFLI
jgi:hypothetical protein